MGVDAIKGSRNTIDTRASTDHGSAKVTVVFENRDIPLDLELALTAAARAFGLVAIATVAKNQTINAVSTLWGIVRQMEEAAK